MTELVRPFSALRGAIVIALLSFFVSITLSLAVSWPVPTIMDEFSYLLAADTFGHGRLTNPAHPMWPYFESPHTIQTPTYCSKYPPAHGLLLGFAGRIWHPILGAWIEAAGAALAIFYLIRAWFGNKWALMGGILAVFHPLQLLWSQCYWGGSLQVAGGALLAGAAVRGWRNPRWTHGAVLGCAASILALSRPYEGAVFSLSIAIVLAIALFRKGMRPAFKAIGALSAGFIPVFVSAMVFLAVYNKATTGDPFLMAYVVHDRRYSGSPLFLWQEPGPFPRHRYEAWHKEAQWERASFDIQRTTSGFWRYLFGLKLLTVTYQMSWYWLLLLPLAAAGIVARKKRIVLVGFGILAFFILAETPLAWWFAHYFAAGLGMVLLLTIEGFVQIRSASPRNGGLLTNGYLSLLIAISLLFQVSGQLASQEGYHWQIERDEIVQKLQTTGGKHLILVSYDEDHSVHAEWVYNGADIDGSKVVFAHALSNNRPIINYFKDRTIWMLSVSAESAHLLQVKAAGEQGIQGASQ